MEEEKEIWGIKCGLEVGDKVKKCCKDLGIQSILPVLSSREKKENGFLWIPLSRRWNEEEEKEIKESIPSFKGKSEENSSSFGFIQCDRWDSLSAFLSQHEDELDSKSIQQLKKKMNHKSPQQELISKMKEKNQRKGDEDETRWNIKWNDKLPQRWEKIGKIIIIKKLDDEIESFKREIGESILEILPSMETVVMDLDGIHGELRQPKIEVIASKRENTEGSITQTVHKEGGIEFELDVSQVMFASGNGTERMHFGALKAKGETIVDMFAGIGYFSVPLSVSSQCSTLFSIEKNPLSHHWLVKNLKRNKGSCEMIPLLGDNRVVGNEALKRADRILMGYIPTPKEFLGRAFQFLKEEGGMIHYHHVCHKEEYQIMAKEHLIEAAKEWLSSSSYVDRDEKGKPMTWQVGDRVFRLEAFRVVKSFAPKLFHCVADIRISIE
eukprot:TRINITY_DN3916_c0_g2_i1.p1 TRINITY_DN3916_c0_g2~~TRINITY_DN3916_c0_g2_i1.p1  ORF type:complete len:457 (-),score=189.11 TRINITY_DN3916_c0_g2_i1:113-1429(-)